MTEDSSMDPLNDADSLDAAVDAQWGRDRDGVGSLRDTEAEAGDEEEITDTYSLDEREARELGVALDGGTDEPRLS